MTIDIAAATVVALFFGSAAAVAWYVTRRY